MYQSDMMFSYFKPKKVLGGGEIAVTPLVFLNWTKKNGVKFNRPRNCSHTMRPKKVYPE